MSTPVWGRVNDILLGHVVDCFGNVHHTFLGDLGGISGNPSMQQTWFWDSGYQDPSFCERAKT
jgi:hypothetical protein